MIQQSLIWATPGAWLLLPPPNSLPPLTAPSPHFVLHSPISQAVPLSPPFPSPSAPISVLSSSLSPEMDMDPSWLQLLMSKPWTSGHSSNIGGLVWVRPCSSAVTQEELSNPRGSWEVSGIVIPISQVRSLRPRAVKSLLIGGRVRAGSPAARTLCPCYPLALQPRPLT